MTWVKEAIEAPMLRSVVQDQIEANTFANLGPFKALPCVSDLEWKKPVIIVGAGSSLKRDLAQLRKAKGYTIIAAAHAWRTLHKAGIHPHYIIHVDGITDEPLTHLVPAKAGLLPTTAGLYQFWAWWCVLGRNRAQGQLWINASKGALFDGFEHVSLKQTLRGLK